MWVDVELEPPFKILDACPTVIEMFGFNEQEIVGRNLRMFQGPMTNTVELAKAIQGSSSDSRHIALVLYNKEGEERIVSVGFRQEDVPNSDKKKCVALIEHGDWVPKKIADAEDGRCLLLALSAPTSSYDSSRQIQDCCVVREALQHRIGQLPPSTPMSSFFFLLSSVSSCSAPPSPTSFSLLPSSRLYSTPLH